jgi:hypothetical protein
LQGIQQLKQRNSLCKFRRKVNRGQLTGGQVKLLTPQKHPPPVSTCPRTYDLRPM